MSNNCPLCHHNSSLFYHYKTKLYHQCGRCSGIFLDASLRLNNTDEKQRYLLHQNDIEDSGYVQFISPITTAVINDFTPEHKGLDFGCGHAPVITKLLTNQQFNIASYDPIFQQQRDLLKQRYDYIVSCEVIEHFYHPDKEFLLLKSLLNEGGRLYCMTDIYHDDIDFKQWYYKNDATHVFIYTADTLAYIKDRLSFSDMIINDRLITFFN